MASSNKIIVFPTALLLLFMVATSSSMADDQQQQWPGAVPNTPGESCYSPWGYPSFEYPLPLCRAVARSRCAGVPVAESARAACCRQLAEVSNEWCKCEALSKMRRIMYKELGVGEAAGKQDEVFPGCRRGAMDLAAASIPAMCKQYIPNTSGGVDGVCYWVNYPLNKQN